MRSRELGQVSDETERTDCVNYNSAKPISKFPIPKNSILVKQNDHGTTPSIIYTLLLRSKLKNLPCQSECRANSNRHLDEGHPPDDCASSQDGKVGQPTNLHPKSLVLVHVVLVHSALDSLRRDPHILPATAAPPNTNSWNGRFFDSLVLDAKPAHFIR